MEFELMTQTQAILQDLKDGIVLSPIEAMHTHGGMRLAARINDLRRDGHRIETMTLNDQGKSYAAYRLKPEDVMQGRLL